MAEDLESKLDSLDPEIKQGFLDALSNRDHSRASEGGFYHKYQLADHISQYISKRSSFDFFAGQKGYKLINWEELKQVGYGITCIDSNFEIPTPILNQLTEWGMMMLYAGIFADRESVDGNMPLSKQLRRFVKAGYNKLHAMHMTKYHQGEYKRPLKIPESQFYRIGQKGKAKDNGLDYIEELIREEQKTADPDKLEDLNERISIVLDSCSKEQRRLLQNKYGKEALGGYCLK